MSDTEITKFEAEINAKECAQQSTEKCSQRWPKHMTTPQPSMCAICRTDITATLVEMDEQTCEQTCVVTKEVVKRMREMWSLLRNGVIGRECDHIDVTPHSTHALVSNMSYKWCCLRCESMVSVMYDNYQHLLEFYHHLKDCPLSSLLNSLSVNNACDVVNDNIVSDNAITIDGNNEDSDLRIECYDQKSKEKHEQSRDSFDRFGDDLCGDLLRHVSLSDCFAFECVSKLFKRSVFGAQKELNICKIDISSGAKVILHLPKNRSFTLNVINETAFKSALKKCLFINELIIGKCYDIDDRIIDIIRENCSQLTSINLIYSFIRISPQNSRLFGEKFGHSLRSIKFNHNYGNKESIQTLFRLTPNLIECEINQLNYLIFETEERELVLPKLKKITANFNETTDFKSFADNYSKRVETIILKGFFNGSYIRIALDLMFSQLFRFQDLEVMNFECHNLYVYPNIDPSSDLIANNFQNLRELYLTCDSYIFHTFGYRFESLRRLTVRPLDKHICFKVYYLSCCPNLKSLNLSMIYRPDLTNIHIHYPKLQCFQLECYEGVNEELLDCLALLNDLYYIKVKVTIVSITDTELRNCINNCQSIRKIDFHSVKSISRETIDTFISNAKLSLKSIYCLRVNVINGNESVSDEEMKDIISGLSKNVNIGITVRSDAKR